MGLYDETWEQLHELKAAREADLKAFLGEPSRANQWSGKGINTVRGVAASLAASPPSNLATADDVRMHAMCLNLARDLSNG
jgi:hypothetical protein